MLVRSVRCPVLVGREAEVHALAAAIEDTGGGTVLVLGEAGVGKSRLANAAAATARSRGMTVLRGRAAPSPAPAPYRPLAEAFLSAVRAGVPAVVPDLPWLRPALGVLVPAWSGAPSERAAAEPSVVLLGEAVLALLGAAGAGRGAFLVLEDLHWADPGTLELLDYLVDKLDATGTTIVGTIRAGEGSAAEEQARSLHARRQATVVELDRLPPGDVARMVAASLGSEDVPRELVGVVQEASDGLPFLVEEVLASLVATDALVREHGTWHVRAPLRPSVPPTFAAAVKERLASLSPSATRVVQAAAVLGDRFDWALLRATADTGSDDLIAGLHQAAALQLVEEDRSGQAFRFRHALTRSAVVETLLPPERAAVAERALAALEVDDGSGAERLELAAQLAETAGDGGRATELLLASACAALRQGAVSSASASAERVLARDPGPEHVLRAQEVLLDASVQAGNLPRASEVGDALLARLEAAGAPPARRAEVHLRLAESSAAATAWPRADHHLAQAAALTPASDDRLGVRRRLLHARADLGRHRIDAASAQIAPALDAAQRLGFDEALCEALELMGRVHRVRDLDEAERWFTRALVAAERIGSRFAHVRALFELGTIDMLRLGRSDRLRAAHDRALEIGTPALAAYANLHLGVLLFFRFELDGARAAAQETRDIAVRYGLGLLVPAADTVLGALDAVTGRRAETVAAFSRALPLMDAELEASGRGQMLALAALAVEDRAAALEELSRAQALSPEGSGVSRAPFRGFLALLLALRSDTPTAILDDLRGSARSMHVVANALGDLARAVLAGRNGDHAAAVALFSTADAALASAPWFRMVGRRLVAEAAIADGWGSPAQWLDEAQAFFAEVGLDELGRACRSLLRLAGSPMARGGVEPGLARAGITRREADVLALVAGGLSNKDIADRLYLSARTVEKHVERLLLKTGTANRAQLAALAARLEPPRT